MLIILVPSILLNIIIWYLYLSYYKNIVSNTSVYSSSVLILNIFLADIVYPKKNLVSFVLIKWLINSGFYNILFKDSLFIGSILVILEK